MCFEPPFIGENLFILGNTIVHNKPKSIPKNYSTKLSLFIEKLLAKSTDNRPSAKEALKLIPKSIKSLDRFHCKKEIESINSDINISTPYGPVSSENNFQNVISQINNDAKTRPISAAIVRSPNVKIKEPAKKEFKIWDLQDEKVKIIPTKSDYQDHSKPTVDLKKEPSLPIKSTTDKALTFHTKKSQKSINVRRLSCEQSEAKIISEAPKQEIIHSPPAEPILMSKNNHRSSNQTPSEKLLNQPKAPTTILNSEPTQGQKIQPIRNNLFQSESFQTTPD